MDTPIEEDPNSQISFIDPMSAEQSFSSNFDLKNPSKAAATYARIMHAHTQRQLQVASRRSSAQNGGNPPPSLSATSSLDSSSDGSIS